jgi:hypothetical protein
MKTNSISVAVDCDGVIANFEGEFCNRFGDANRHLFDLHKRYPEVDPELITEFVNSPDTYADLEPMFGGVLLTNHLHRLGFNIVIMTNRPKAAQGYTKEWLENYHVPFTDLVFAKHKSETIEDYNRFYLNQPIKMLIDDLTLNLESLPTGVVGIAWEQPWNEGYYPRARYNPDNMKIEICNDTVSWKEMWRNEQ